MDIASYLLGKSSSGGSETSNYEDLTNKPSINGVPLVGNKTSEDLGIGGDSDIIVIPKNSYYYTEELIEKVNGEYQKYLNNKEYNLYFQFTPDGQSDIVTVKGEFFGNVLRNAFTENDRVSSYYNRIVSAKCIFRFNGTQIIGIQGITSIYIRYSNSAKVNGVLLAHDNQFEYTPSSNYNPATKKYVDELPKTYTGYDATKTQVLKNINGTLTWVDEE